MQRFFDDTNIIQKNDMVYRDSIYLTLPPLAGRPPSASRTASRTDFDDEKAAPEPGGGLFSRGTGQETIDFWAP